MGKIGFTKVSCPDRDKDRYVCHFYVLGDNIKTKELSKDIKKVLIKYNCII